MAIDRPTIEKVKNALRFSTAEGMAYGAMLGFGDSYIVAFAVALQTGSFQIGVLCSLPGFLASLAQLWDAEFARLLKSRKAVILVFALLQGLMFLPMLTLVFLSRANTSWLLIAFASLYSISGALVSPAWGSVMAEIVPESLRGRYFSLRGSLSTLANTVTLLAGGLFLSVLAHKALWGFALLFGAALVARLVSFGLLTRLYEMPAQTRSQHRVRGRDFARNLASTTLGKYMLFLFFMSFAVNIASPYFAVYQLRDLKIDYVTFAALGTASSGAALLTVTRWGRAADRAGNFRMMLLASALITLVPLLWLLSADLVYLGLVQAFSGFAWAGFGLCSVNYMYDATTPQNRTRYLAYFNAGNGLAAGLGALLGGYMATHLPALRGHAILSLSLISGLLRAAVSLLFLPRLVEVRTVSKIPAADLFHIVLGGRPVDRRMGHRRHALFQHYEQTAPSLEKPDTGEA